MENQIINLSLPLKQVNVILASLGKQPLETVIEAFAAIQEQAKKQIDSPVTEASPV